MKFKLDENLPISLREFLSNLNYDVETVFSQNLQGKTDTEIWKVTQKENRILITQDLDFSDIRKYPLILHPGVIVLRLSNPSQRSILEKMKTIFSTENVETWGKCLIIITDRKIRIKRFSL